MKKRDIDFEGVEFTAPLVQSLNSIHKKHFHSALKKIEKTQKRYKKKYDRKHNATIFNLKIGEKVQYKRYLSKNTLSKKHCTLWTPATSYYLILKVNQAKKRVLLQTPQGQVLKRSHPFDRIRKYRGKN